MRREIETCNSDIQNDSANFAPPLNDYIEEDDSFTHIPPRRFRSGISRDRKKFPAEIRDIIREEQDNKCALLGTEEEYLEIHHIIPKAHGGSGTRENGIAVAPEVHRILDELAFNFKMYFPEVMERGREYVIGRLNAVPIQPKSEEQQTVSEAAAD